MRYEAGNEHNPVDQVGRTTLEVAADGAVRLDRRSRFGHEAWTARVEPGFFEQLSAALEAAGFPDAPMIMPVPDEAIRNLQITGTPAGSVSLPWYGAAKLPGYAEAFTLLDALVSQLSGLDLRVPSLDPPATDVRRVSG